MFSLELKTLIVFRVIVVAKERSRLVAERLIPTGKPIPLARAAIEIPLVMAVVVTRLMSRTAVIVPKRFIFFASFSRASISSKKYASISVIFAR